MSRILIFLIAAAVAAMALVYGLRNSRKGGSAAVASLLPRETVAFAHVPDFSRTRQQWHESDIYQLYREPSVQEFLGKPLSRIPRTNSFAQTAQEIETLDLKDGFLALTSFANNDIKVVGGFRFRGSEGEAEKIIGRWRAHLLRESSSAPAKHERVEHQQHKIDIYGTGPSAILNVYDGNWFFVSNDLPELKALLDRADGRARDQQAQLNADDTFREAMGEMPAGYALLFYLQPKIIAQKLTELRTRFSQTNIPQHNMFEQYRSICATMQFENGKIHDVAFVGMSQQEDETLTRSSLAIATRDTFLYVASLINFSKQLALLDSNSSANFLGAGLQKIDRALAAAKINSDDWKAAFGSEAGFVADWPGDNHWPSALSTCQVKDVPRAKKIVTALLYALDEDGYWRETDRDGIHYWTMEKGPSFIAIRPVIALSSRTLIAGLDNASVEAAVHRSDEAKSGLSNSEPYKSAVRLVPAPTSFFAYADPGLLYSRLDATLRPMLLMSAAFMPWINDYVDVGKLPTAEIVTKHLGPIVSSRRYNGRGYIAESVGPITLDQAGIAVGLMAGFGAIGYQRGLGSPLSPSSLSPTSSPSTSGGWTGKGLYAPNQASPSPSPSETP